MINWKLRFKNKTTLMAIVLATIAFIYQLISLFGVVPSISQETVINLAVMVINLLVLLGVVVDPTTDGISDSTRAMGYNEPNAETWPDAAFPVGGEGAGDFEDEHEIFDPADPSENEEE